MPDLIAQGPLPQNRWRRQLPRGETIVLGRTAPTWSVPWDDQISRQHAELHWHQGRLDVKKNATATNQLKEATLETGLRTKVPPFINIGDVVRVSTDDGSYTQRVNE